MTANDALPQLNPPASASGFTFPQITAAHLESWSRTRSAQDQLPRLIRRLVASVHGLRLSDFPAGAAVSSGGWDGRTDCEQGNAWVPDGPCFWEVSCEADAQAKVKEDYEKRTAATAEAVRQNAAFVFVTPRRWPGKARWRAKATERNDWRDVRAYDAVDLEQWIEREPAVALEYGRLLGVTSRFVRHPSDAWRAWATVTQPELPPDSILAGREPVAKLLQERLASGHSDIRLAADSVEEAVAFAAACLLLTPDLSNRAALLIAQDGWDFVDANPRLSIVLLSRPEHRHDQPLRSDRQLIIPLTLGQLRVDDRETLQIRRPPLETFPKSLAALGRTPQEVERLARESGRSWPVLRRRLAADPAMRKPHWLTESRIPALAALALAGRWSEDNRLSDREFVTKVAGRPYEEVQSHLIALAQEDESPVVSVDGVWGAKAQLDLLDVMSPYMTDAMLDRFFSNLDALLCTPDPKLELEPTERFAASVHGKGPIVSGHLHDGLGSTLAIMGARGTQLSGFADRFVEGRASALARNLFDGADETRWLSLSDWLPSFAEAAPEAFLDALEADLHRESPRVFALFKESAKEGGFGGRCWHSGLLWALERMAWSPRRLPRVAVVLAKLMRAPKGDNWANTPLNSIAEIVMPWFPQTLATPAKRLQVIDRLMEHSPAEGWTLLCALTIDASYSVSMTARPVYRDWSDGAAERPEPKDVHEMYAGLAERLLRYGLPHLDRCVQLLRGIRVLPPEEQQEVIRALLDRAPGLMDAERVLVRDELRSLLHQLLNHSKDDEEPESAELLQKAQALYEALRPADRVSEVAWLFGDSWNRLPVRAEWEEAEGIRRDMQQEALASVFQEGGADAVRRLIDEANSPGLVGALVAQDPVILESLTDWLLDPSEPLEAGSSKFRALNGALHAPPGTLAAQWLPAAAKVASSDLERHGEWLAQFLLAAPVAPLSWEFAARHGGKVEFRYWANVRQAPWNEGVQAWEQFIREMIKAKRPRAALQFLWTQLKELRPDLILDLVEALARGDDAEPQQMIESYVLGEAMARLRDWPEMDPKRLLQLEFVFFELLEHSTHPPEAIDQEIARSPEFFVELLCYCYKPRNTPREELNEEAVAPHVASRSYAVLSGSRALPGSGTDRALDRAKLKDWIATGRKLALEKDRLEVFEHSVGQLLAHAPGDLDGHWPCRAVAEVLDDPAAAALRKGFELGVYNSRGFTSRGMNDGGDQERDLVDRYTRAAAMIEDKFPHAAACVRRLAQSYTYDAKRMDRELQRRTELD